MPQANVHAASPEESDTILAIQGAHYIPKPVRQAAFSEAITQLQMAASQFENAASIPAAVQRDGYAAKAAEIRDAIVVLTNWHAERAPAKIEELLVWAVEDGVIRMSQVMSPDLQDALVRFAKRLSTNHAQAPKSEPVERSAAMDAVIRDVFLANGFTIKEGQLDLKGYVFDAAYALIAAAQVKR